jgi:two-component system sensor histidine kinase HydH
MLGRDPAELLPEPLLELLRRLGPEQTLIEQTLECAFRQVGDAGEGADCRPLAVSGVAIVSEQGNFVGNALILKDLTELRRLQQEVRRKEKLAAVGSLAAGVAHEIRNPLSSIKASAAYFGSRFEEGSDGQAMAGHMAQEVDRLNRVITQLLDLARPSEVKPRKADLPSLVDRSLGLIRQDAEDAGVAVRYEHEGPAAVTVDPDRMIQALLNLHLNAVQAMDGGGELTVRTGPDPDGRPRIEVADTGPGIPEPDLSKVFDPYYTTKPSGTGLGLAIVQKVVEAHGGEVAVHSEPGRGTTVSLVLPRDTWAQENT